MKLKRVNDLLLAAVVLVNVYTIGMPFVPQASYWWQNRHGKKEQLQAKAAAPVSKPSEKQPPKQQFNSVTIPSMLLDGSQIYEGPKWQMYRVLDKGVWHWPDSSTPDKGGNTVLLGHRFTYTNPRGVLYFLNKVKVGDIVGITWNQKKYVYTVTNVQEVSPSDGEVVAQTPDPTLTIYTCTPLWHPVDRLVVTAKLEKTP